MRELKWQITTYKLSYLVLNYAGGWRIDETERRGLF